LKQHEEIGTGRFTGIGRVLAVLVNGM
jgi:hypothetical protein